MHVSTLVGYRKCMNVFFENNRGILNISRCQQAGSGVLRGGHSAMPPLAMKNRHGHWP